MLKIVQSGNMNCAFIKECQKCATVIKRAVIAEKKINENKS
jgi:hypothetical protein